MTESVNSTQEQFQADENAVTLGQRLKSARETLNLSIADVAAKTNLKRSHIESLENDIFILKGIAPAFVRGYVRNYAKFLHLPESVISSVNYGDVTISKDDNKVAPVNSYSDSQGRSLKYLTILVLLSALGMTLLWWWQGYQKEQESLEKLVKSVSNEATLPVQSQTISIQQPIQVQTETKIVENKNISETVQFEPALTEKVELTQPGIIEVAPEEIKPVTETTQNEVANILQQQEEVKVDEQIEQPAEIGNDELRIEITGSKSWITVRDANNKRLAENLYDNGEILTFNDNEQYRLTIGAPINVKVYYKGQEVPLKIDGRVVRLRLPLQ